MTTTGKWFGWPENKKSVERQIPMRAVDNFIDVPARPSLVVGAIFPVANSLPLPPYDPDAKKIDLAPLPISF